MSSAGKWGDPVVGVDIHMVMCPPFAPPTPLGVPTPLPHPFIGVVFDPVGAAMGAAFGAVFGGGGPVFVNGLPCANTGTDAEAIYHEPTKPGVCWAPMDLPDEEGTIILGSAVMTCNFPINLPSSVCMSVPIGPPVNIGGPDALDVMAAATKAIRTKWELAKGEKFR